MKIYYFDSNGKYAGNGESYTFPNTGATKIAPPDYDQTTKYAVFDSVNKAWIIHDIPPQANPFNG